MTVQSKTNVGNIQYFGFTFGEPTEYWIDNNQIRIGIEGPRRITIVLSTGNGEFPIRPLVNTKTKEEVVFSSQKQAYDYLVSVADKINAVKRETE